MNELCIFFIEMTIYNYIYIVIITTYNAFYFYYYFYFYNYHQLIHSWNFDVQWYKTIYRLIEPINFIQILICLDVQ